MNWASRPVQLRPTSLKQLPFSALPIVGMPPSCSMSTRRTPSDRGPTLKGSPSDPSIRQSVQRPDAQPTLWAPWRRGIGKRTMTSVSPLALHGSSSSPSASPLALDRSPLPFALSATSSNPVTSSVPRDAVAHRLHRYEELLRDAHVAGLELTLDLRRIQADAGLSAITGHQLFSRLDEAQTQVTAAIATAAASHKLARVLAPSAGINPLSYGEVTEP